jgi:YD repeat-containing protein
MKQLLLFSKFLSDYLQGFLRKQLITNQLKKAIKFIAVLLLMFYATNSEAQTTQFSYDVAGNRIKREIILQKSSRANIDSTTFSSTKPVIEKIGEMRITIFPNPTLGQLSVEITNRPHDVSGELWLYNITGNLLQYLKTLGTTNPIDLSTYPTGIYVLRVNIGGKPVEWKIVKK